MAEDAAERVSRKAPQKIKKPAGKGIPGWLPFLHAPLLQGQFEDKAFRALAGNRVDQFP